MSEARPQGALRAADSHHQNEAYLERLGEAMARLGMKGPVQREPAEPPERATPLGASVASHDRTSKLTLIKEKLRRRSSGEDAPSRTGDRTAGIRGSSRGGEKTGSRTGLKLGGEPSEVDQREVSLPQIYLADEESGSGSVAEMQKTERRSSTEYDLNGRRVSGRLSKPSASMKPGTGQAQPMQRPKSSQTTSNSDTSTPSNKHSMEDMKQVPHAPTQRKQRNGRAFPYDDAPSVIVQSEGLDWGSRSRPADEGPSTSGAPPFLEPHSHHHIHSLDRRWEKAPLDAAGRVTKLSEQPILCMSVLGSEAVVGSSDHALYTVDLDTGQKRRTLYGKTAGHTEWVTCVAHLPDGRILSGGMDNRLLLWASTGATHIELTGHNASISAVRSSSDGSLAVSSSYDKTLRVWALPGAETRGAGRSRGAGFKGTATCLMGHVAPVLDFVWASGRVVSGARDGCVILWDIGKAAASRRLLRAHSGHVTALAWSDANGSPQAEGRPSLVLTGGQDGYLRAWDGRSEKSVAEVPVHVASNGAGAVSSICSAPNAVVTAGADGKVRVLDPRASFRVRHTIAGPGGFIYSLHVAGTTAFSGGNNGSVLVHDFQDGGTFYGLGAINNGAVRCIETTDSKLVCAGDDGTLITYCY